MRALAAFATLALAAPTAPPPLVINTAFKAPFSTADQQGTFDRVTAEAFRRVGRTVRIQQLPAQRGLANANAGVEDGDGPRVRDLAKMGTFEHLIQIPEPVMRLEFVALTTDPRVKTTDWASLAAYDLALIRGWKILEKNTAGMASVVRVRNAEQLIRLLAKGRAQVALVDPATGLHAARGLGVEGLRRAGPALATRDRFIYLHKRHAALAPKLAEALRAMQADGTFARLSRRAAAKP